jgi:hypothetical protein
VAWPLALRSLVTCDLEPKPSQGSFAVASVSTTVSHAGATTIECPVCHQVYVALKTPPSLTEALGMHLEIEHGVVAP